MAGRRKPCRTCLRIRIFMMCALPLIIMIGLQPSGMVRLAGMVPSTGWIAALMMLSGTAGFFLRYRKYKSQS
ncbi:disulfide bond formation protein B [Donghicola sp. C2-DW-16]|uniref:Disulfide bond formation protein B n=1 Tax=Donghicola mangrovi TaxID=2729614 RepID=A0A850PXW2_9RHOB|nr:disulfide bond formation protein B [Donghicola mangrovi]NVO22057.1 disulfide bond formation protein B [Donghicola mangrovi]NVO26352.1 disulfide bond formation protein B [Donghicola mangrovi]